MVLAMVGLSAAATGVALDNTAMIVAGMLVGASGTMLTRQMAAAMNRSVPSIVAVILPADGRTMPMMDFIRVDLPLPLVPSSATVSPSPTRSDTSCRMRTAP